MVIIYQYTVKNNPVKKKNGKLLAAVVASIIPIKYVVLLFLC